MRRLASSILIALLTALVVQAGTAPAALAQPALPAVTVGEAEGTFLTLLNQARAAGQLPPLVSDAKLASTSRSWSSVMASQGLKHDPNLAAVAASVEPAWRLIGENVGMGPTVRSIHDAFMRSTAHRDNIMSRRYNRVGIGVAISGSTIWVTVRFLEGPSIVGPTGLAAPKPIVKREVVTGDFNGDGLDDVLTYASGADADELWMGRRDRKLQKVPVSINGTYQPISGDFDGDGRTEILWYAPGAAPDSTWRWNGSSWTSTPVTINGHYQPFSGDFDGDGIDDILWYAPGHAPDFYWYGVRGGGFVNVQTSISGTYRPFVGDFDGQSGDDIFWYAPGPHPDAIWYSVGTRGGRANAPLSVTGTYHALAGDVDGNGTDDIFWYAPGSHPDSVWFTGAGRGSYRSEGRTVNGHYLPAIGDFDGNAAADILWFTPSSAAGDPLWFGEPGASYVSASLIAG